MDICRESGEISQIISALYSFEGKAISGDVNNACGLQEGKAGQMI